MAPGIVEMFVDSLCCSSVSGLLFANLGLLGHSCNIGNAPNLVEKNQKLRSECCQSIFDMGLHSL